MTQYKFTYSCFTVAIYYVTDKGPRGQVCFQQNTHTLVSPTVNWYLAGSSMKDFLLWGKN